MSDPTPFTAEEIAELRKLLEIEKIRKVRTLYCQLIDGLRIDELAELLHEDAVTEFGPYGTLRGKKAIYENYKTNFIKDRVPYAMLHHASNLWIELTGPTTAISRSFLHDTHCIPDPRTNPVKWLGIYDEDYEKVAGKWLIKHSRLQFLWPQKIVTEGFPRAMPISSIG